MIDRITKEEFANLIKKQREEKNDEQFIVTYFDNERRVRGVFGFFNGKYKCRFTSMSYYDLSDNKDFERELDRTFRFFYNVNEVPIELCDYETMTSRIKMSIKVNVYEQLQDKKSTLTHIKQFVEENIGGLVIDHEGHWCMLCGAYATDEDYYYILCSVEGYKPWLWSDSCVGRLNLLKKEDYNSIDLDYEDLLKTGLRYYGDALLEAFLNYDTVLFTPFINLKDYVSKHEQNVN